MKLAIMLAIVLILVNARAENSVPPGHEMKQCTALAVTQPRVGNLIEETIMQWEGWSEVRYRLPNEVSVGYGTRLTAQLQPLMSSVSNGRLDYRLVYSGRQTITRQEGVLLLRETIELKRRMAEKALPQFNSYPERIRAAIVDGFYRGDLAGSPKTLKLIREGRWVDASRELLDNKEYREAAARRMGGVVRRMDWRSQVFKSYGEGRL